MSDTPRTNALKWSVADDGVVLLNFARQLERENEALKEKLSDTHDQLCSERRKVDALKAVLKGAEYERVDELAGKGAEFCMALGMTAAKRTKELVAEIAALKAENERLRAQLDLYAETFRAALGGQAMSSNTPRTDAFVESSAFHSALVHRKRSGERIGIDGVEFVIALDLSRQLEREIAALKADTAAWHEIAGRQIAALNDTLRRIAREIVAVAPDSGQSDSIGEIYHLLRECGAL